ncbi:hypothetical protein HDU93_006940 [Gonapodya sp. JEL0774]|nr:hypothetical protein HDU93_006940 [Gonapodya sp. JEL0774]
MASKRLVSGLARGERIVAALTRAQLMLTISGDTSRVMSSSTRGAVFTEIAFDGLDGEPGAGNGFPQHMVPPVSEALAQLPENAYISALLQDAHALVQCCGSIFALIDSEHQAVPTLNVKKRHVEDLVLLALGPSGYLPSFAALAPVAASSIRPLGGDLVDLLMLSCVEAAAAVREVCEATGVILYPGNWTPTKVERQDPRAGGIVVVNEARAQIYAPHVGGGLVSAMRNPISGVGATVDAREETLGRHQGSHSPASQHARVIFRAATSFLESALGVPHKYRRQDSISPAEISPDISMGPSAASLFGDPSVAAPKTQTLSRGRTGPSSWFSTHASDCVDSTTQVSITTASSYPVHRIPMDFISRLRSASSRLVGLMHVLVDRAIVAAEKFALLSEEKQEYGIVGVGRLWGVVPVAEEDDGALGEPRVSTSSM